MTIRGEGARGEMEPGRYFGKINTFDDAIQLLKNTPADVSDSRGIQFNIRNFGERIDDVAATAMAGSLVEGEQLTIFTREQDFRNAIARAVGTSISEGLPGRLTGKNTNEIVKILKQVLAQNQIFKSVKIEDSSFLYLKDTSGNSINITETIQTINHLADFLSDPTNDRSLANMYMATITSNYGLKDAVKAAVGLV